MAGERGTVLNMVVSRTRAGGGVVFGLALWAGACSPESAPDSTLIDPILPEGENGGSGATGGPPQPPGGVNLGGALNEPAPPGCGDGTLDEGERCDDANTESADGCAANCLVVEAGYVCPSPGSQCERTEVCGDSFVFGNENCDDGNSEAEDGCSTTCRVEANFACPTPGEACLSTVDCGDSTISGPETCDDGNEVEADGCSPSCQVEAGWECSIAGTPCVAICGDGTVNGRELCDDGNTNAGDGCSANCQLEPGFVCRDAGVDCERTVCQDGTKEGSEQCDDGNDIPYDGCTAACTVEPRCREVQGVYQCEAVCGDGMLFPEEECDDGNTSSGDGCSEGCLFERGFNCENAAAVAGATLTLPIIYRDFSSEHPQFEIVPPQDGRLPGIVRSTLSAEGRPVYNSNFSIDINGESRPWTMDGPTGNVGQIPLATGPASLLTPEAIAARFDEWYADSPNLAEPEQGNRTLIDELVLSVQPDDSFQFSASGNDIPPAQFFPLDGEGFGDEGNANNFHFTSEVRQWFVSQGGELLQFTGDDDVWVFVNGLLTVDLGGIHGEIEGSIELSESGVNSELCVQNVTAGAVTCSNLDVPIFAEGVNEIVVFQAERHVTQSNYTLTLRGFNAPITSCEGQCGNGVITGEEFCDDGDDNGAGYGFCGEDCLPGPRCGDGVVDTENEGCDNGVNLDRYQTSTEACAPGCEVPSSCGDGIIDSLFGEQCDDGEELNDNRYGGCSDTCNLGPRCGDGERNGEEECDDGNRVNGDGCDVACFVEAVPA